MNTCETCKWWDDIWQQYGSRQGWNEGACRLTIAEREGTPETVESEIEGEEGSKAHCLIIFPDVLDGVFARSILVTQKDFGCTQYTPRGKP